jgi:hypothetical protein
MHGPVAADGDMKDFLIKVDVHCLIVVWPDMHGPVPKIATCRPVGGRQLMIPAPRNIQ